MRKTTHSLIGTWGDRVFHVWAMDQSGAEIQRDLLAAGCRSLVMFDGGSAAFYDDGTIRSTARSPALTGLGIHTR